MNEEPKSIWKKSWKGSNLLGAWLILVVASLLIVQAVTLFVPGRLSNLAGEMPAWLLLLAASTVLATVFLGAWLFVRWLCSWKNFRRFLFACACLVTLIALFYAEEDWRGKHDWEKFKRQWEAKGETFDFIGIIPPAVPDDQNFAFSPVWIGEEKFLFQDEPEKAEAWYGKRIYSQEVSNIVTHLPVSVSGLVGTNNYWGHPLPVVPEVSSQWAMARLTDLKPWQSYYRNLETTNPEAKISITPQPQSPAADVLLALSKFDPVIERLRQDSMLPYSRFPIGYDDEDKAAILLPHLAAVKRHSQVLQLRALAELQNRQSDQTLADVKLMLRLVDSVRTEPFLISHLVRIATVNLALQPIYEGLAHHQWSDAQLADLDSELAKLDFLADYEFSMRGGRACDIANIEFLRNAHKRPLQYIHEMSSLTGGESSMHTLPMFALAFGPSGWFYQNELRFSRFYSKWYLPLVDDKGQTVSLTAARAADVAFGAEIRHQTPENLLEAMLLSPMAPAARRFAYAQSSVNLARVAIALERYRLAHGEYPESLDALAPQFIAKIPHDIINGEPLHYHRTSDGQFVLYSVGWNGTNDGGVVGYAEKSSPRDESPSRVDINQGDWVWRYPQK